MIRYIYLFVLIMSNPYNGCVVKCDTPDTHRTPSATHRATSSLLSLLVAQFCATKPCGIVWTKQGTPSATFSTIGITICVLIHLIRHRKPIEVALGAFRYNHIKAKIKSLISLLIALYTHNTQTFYLFLIGTQVTLFSKKANWHTRRNRVVKVIYVCMCPDLPLYK